MFEVKEKCYSCFKSEGEAMCCRVVAIVSTCVPANSGKDIDANGRSEFVLTEPSEQFTNC